MNNKYVIKLALDELNDMQIKSRTLVSKHTKKQITDEELANHIDELRQNLINKASELSEVLSSLEFKNVYVENLADKYNKKLNVTHENVYDYLNELYEDIADLYQVVNNLTLEELAEEGVIPAEKIIELQAVQVINDINLSRGAKIRGLKKHLFKGYDLSIAPKKTSNLRYVKSTDAREREANKQKEAQREMKKSESQPEMTARQMSR